jgi:hypothetical protein
MSKAALLHVMISVSLTIAGCSGDAERNPNAGSPVASGKNDAPTTPPKSELPDTLLTEPLGDQKLITQSREVFQRRDLYGAAKTKALGATRNPETAPEKANRQADSPNGTGRTRAVAFTRPDGYTSYEGTLLVDIGGMSDWPSVNLSGAIVRIPKGRWLATGLDEAYGFGIERSTLHFHTPQEGKDAGLILFDQDGGVKERKYLDGSVKTEWTFSKGVRDVHREEFSRLLSGATVLGWATDGVLIKGSTGKLLRIDALKGEMVEIKSPFQFLGLNGEQTKF